MSKVLLPPGLPGAALLRGRRRCAGAWAATGALMLCALTLAASAGPARAATLALPYQSSFSVGWGAKSIAVNHETGNVLVLDWYDTSITQYDATGTPTPFTDPALAGATTLSNANVPSLVPGSFNEDTGVDIDNSGTASQGTIYVIDGRSLNVLVFSPSGELTQTIMTESPACGLSVAPDGKLWIGTRVPDTNDTYADQYTSAGIRTGLRVRKPPKMYQDAWMCDVQVDGDGAIYARPFPNVAKYSPDGVFQTTVAYAANAMAVEPVTGNVFILGMGGDGYRVRQTAPDGELLEEIGEGTMGLDTSALALGPGGRDMYVVNGGGQVLVFGPAVRRPELEAPGGIGTSSVSLTGTVWPGGAATTYRFEYGTKKTLGSVAPAVPVDAGSGTAPVAASTVLTGLAPNTYYYYRLVATVGGADVAGPTRTLRTLGPAAAITGFSAVAPTSVTLTGSADPRDLADGTYRFRVTQVGGGFETVSAEAAVPAGSGARPVSATIAGLPAGKTFTARLVASAGGVTASSGEITFGTPALPVLGVPRVPEFGPTPYGCAVPRLDALSGASRRAGDVVTVTGSDLGSGGTLLLGGERVAGAGWSSTGVRFTVPRGASGTLAVSVDCGRPSNGVALKVAAASNRITLGKAAINGSGATVSVKVPGAGRVSTAGKYVAGSAVTVKKAGTVKAKLRLSAAGRRALERSHRLTLSVRVRFVPDSGDGRTETKTITFTRGGAR